jgi:hypothetical protein
MNRSDVTLFDARIADWLEDDPLAAPDQALDVVLAAFPSIKQRRAWRVPWRFPEMSSLSKLVAALATVVIVAVGGVYLLAPRPSTPGGPAPTPSPSPAPTATPSLSATLSPSNELINTSNWIEYTSDRYGFDIGYPSDWVATPSDRDWTFAEVANHLSDAHEVFRSPGATIRVSAWVAPWDPGTTLDDVDIPAWVEAYCIASGNTGCNTVADRAVPMCQEKRDCHPAMLVPFKDDVQAFIPGDLGMTIVAIWRNNDPSVDAYGGATQLLEAFLETMNVWPSPAG